MRISPLTAGFVLFFVAGVSIASKTGVTHRLGASGGFPQLVALTWQVTPSKFVSLEGCIGSLPFYYNTAGFRMIIGDTSRGLKPRGFVGIAVVDHVYSANSDATASYLWTGAGLGYAFDHFRLFLDLGYFAGEIRIKALVTQQGWLSIAVFSLTFDEVQLRDHLYSHAF